jgi:endo-1,3-1,4-beta-glycanase ExoK
MLRISVLVLVVIFLAGCGGGSMPFTPPHNEAKAFASTGSFSYTFTSLNPNVWIVSNWGAPGGGVFRPANVDTSQGLLRLKLTQVRNSNGSISSTGGEIQSRQRFGYGTYVWVMRAASTASSYLNGGSTASGSVSASFMFYNNSQTEIDAPEIEGQHPNTVWDTNWLTTSHKQSTACTVYGTANGFFVYKMVWAPSKITYYVNGTLCGTHTSYIPSAPAYIMINLWGTNSTGWGGLASPGVTRYMYVRSVSYSLTY